eukprot:3125164-Pyramimonas_sp.AAC.2
MMPWGTSGRGSSSSFDFGGFGGFGAPSQVTEHNACLLLDRAFAQSFFKQRENENTVCCTLQQCRERASPERGLGCGLFSQPHQDDEPFYGLDDFFKDMEKEWAKQEANGGVKSLWDELEDIGEPLHHWRIQFSTRIFTDAEKVPELRVVR